MDRIGAGRFQSAPTTRPVPAKAEQNLSVLEEFGSDSDGDEDLLGHLQAQAPPSTSSHSKIHLGAQSPGGVLTSSRLGNNRFASAPLPQVRVRLGSAAVGCVPMNKESMGFVIEELKRTSQQFKARREAARRAAAEGDDSAKEPARGVGSNPVVVLEHGARLGALRFMSETPVDASLAQGRVAPGRPQVCPQGLLDSDDSD